MPLSPAKSESDRLTGLLRPKYVAAWSDHDALFQGSVEALGEFGKAEILDHPEILVAQQFRQLDRIERSLTDRAEATPKARLVARQRLNCRRSRFGIPPH